MQVLELLNQFEEIENAKVLGNAAAAAAADSAIGRRNHAEAFDMILRQFFASESTQAVLQLQEWVQQIREQRTRAKDARTREADSVLIASLDTDGYECVRLRADCASPFPPTPWCPTYCAHFAILWGRVLFGVSYRDGTISINEFVELWRTTGLSKPVLRQHFRRRDLGSVGQLSQPPALHARAHPGALSLLNSLPHR